MVERTFSVIYGFLHLVWDIKPILLISDVELAAKHRAISFDWSNEFINQYLSYRLESNEVYRFVAEFRKKLAVNI